MQVAGEIAAEMAKHGPRAHAEDPLTRAQSLFARKSCAAVRSGVAVVTDLPQAVESLTRPLCDKTVAGVGVAVVAAGESVYVVVLLGSR